jgi:hypothetical protein
MYGVNWRWGGRLWRSFDFDGFSYWHIHPVINRKPSDEAGWEDESS